MTLQWRNVRRSTAPDQLYSCVVAVVVSLSLAPTWCCLDFGVGASLRVLPPPCPIFSRRPPANVIQLYSVFSPSLSMTFNRFSGLLVTSSISASVCTPRWYLEDDAHSLHHASCARVSSDLPLGMTSSYRLWLFKYASKLLCSFANRSVERSHMIHSKQPGYIRRIRSPLSDSP